MKNTHNDARTKKRNVQKTILKAFIPFTEENILLAYSPNRYFNRLEYMDRLVEMTQANRETVRVTISRAKRAGLLSVGSDGAPSTTWRGKIKAKVRPISKTQRSLIIIFDIPEARKKDRNQLRAYLQSNYCQMVQKSVWQTKYDIYDELLEVIEDIGIVRFVNVFMADKLK